MLTRCIENPAIGHSSAIFAHIQNSLEDLRFSFFAKMVKNYKAPLALCIVRYMFRTMPIVINSDIFRDIHVLFRHIQPCCVAYLETCVILAYSETYHI